MDFASGVDQIDQALKAAQFKQAKSLFLKLIQSKWSRPQLLPLCQLARRLVMPQYIVRCLHPIVRSETLLSAPASAEEQALYAMGLTQLGSFGEAVEILEPLQNGNSAEALSYLAETNMWQWKYHKALKPLEQLVSSLPCKDYKSLVARLNLAASYSGDGQYLAAEEQIQILKENSNLAQHRLLIANAHEVAAQIAIKRSDFSLAEKHLQTAGEIFGGNSSLYSLLAEKWKLIIALQRDCTQGNGRELDDLKRRAQAAGATEIVRELDLYSAIADRDESLFMKVYHGTHFAEYKKRMKQIYGKTVGGYREFSIDLDCKGKSRTSGVSRIDLKSGAITNLSGSTMISGLGLKLLQIVASDFYRSFRIGELARSLYPDEYFNPFSTPKKLYQVFSTLNHQLRECHSNLLLKWDKNSVGMNFLGQVALEKTGSHQSLPPSLNQFLKGKEMGSVFRSQEFATYLGQSERSAQRILSQALDKKKLRRLKPGCYVASGFKTAM